jgi:hypothetical protein
MAVRFFASASSRPSVRLLLAITAVCGLFSAGATGTSPRFYDDDPIAREPETQDALRAQAYDIKSLYEMTYNLFVTAGYKPSGMRAKNINTIDEVPDSSWFTNRIGTTAVSLEEIARGPNRGAPPDPSRWIISRYKTEGAHPGVTARDAKGETWFLEFDPSSFPRGRQGPSKSRRRSSGRSATTRSKPT